jgi:resuscitation-promoting factor RpfB
MYHRISSVLIFFCLLIGCSSPTQAVSTVTIKVDGTSKVVPITTEISISDVLRKNNITPGLLDRVNPPPSSRVSDGMIIEIVRVEEKIVVEQVPIPFQRRTVPNESLPAGQTQLLNAGIAGVAEVTYRITYEDGVEVGQRNEIRRVEITLPKDEVVMVGSQGDLPTVTVNGTLTYISGRNIWITRQNSANKRPLTDDGGVDGRVFELSEDGQRLLFTRNNSEIGRFGGDGATAEAVSPEQQLDNSLWVIFDTAAQEPEAVRLDLNNILYAEWVPGTERTIVYSTAEPRPGWPGWQANNDLWTAQISATGAIISPERLLEPSSGGVYGFYGTYFDFSPDGVTLAWAQPDAVGVLIPDYESGEDDGEETATIEPTPVETIEPEASEEPDQTSGLPPGYTRQTLASFAPRNAYDFVWVPGLAWSPDGGVLITTLHGDPLGGEAPEDSPIFNLAALLLEGAVKIDLGAQVGMWSMAQYGPLDEDNAGGLLAFLQSTNPLDSVSSRYQLIVMDRDGSNRRIAFPSADEPGLSPGDLDYKGFVWSPNGREIALIYQGNLFLVDVITGLKQQITQDGQAGSPRWAP